MPALKILMLGWEYPPFISGGLGIACEGIVEALRPLTELTLLLPDQNQAPSAYADSAGTLYHGDLSARVRDFAREALETGLRQPFDLIHAHDWMTALAGLALQRQTGKPLVFQVHSLTYDRAGPQERGWIYEIEKKVISQADLVITVSDYTRQICLDHYQAAPAKTVTVHNGIAPRLPHPARHAHSSGVPLVLFLGRLASQKAPSDFLKIAARVSTSCPRAHFVMAGSGELLAALMAEAQRLGIREKVHFTGFLNRREVRELLAMTDAYCMPSLSEPFGLSALEAAQFGIPLVISKQAGVAEILPEARTAEAGDLAGFAKHLIDIIAETEPKKGPIFPLRSWEEAGAEILECYRKLT